MSDRTQTPGQARPVTGPAVARMLGDWRRGEAPLYVQLGRTLAELLADGRLAVGTRLPAERTLAAELAVSRNTVTRAYEWLVEHDMLDRRQGSGSVTRPARRTPRAALWSDVAAVHPEPIDLTVAAGPPPAGLGDVVRATAEDGQWLSGHGYTPFGLPQLREAVARRYTERGLPTRPGQVMITAGAQHALDLVSRLLVRRGDAVLVESPAYQGALSAFRLAGARLAAFDVAHDGWNAPAIADLAARTQAQVAYLVPDFQNPTGRVMPDEVRVRLMEGLRRLPVTVVVDETLVDLPLDAPAGTPLRAPDSASTVIAVGSLSKAVWAGLRIGWVRAPERIVNALGTIRAAADVGSAVFEQAVAVAVLDRLDALLLPRRATLREQRDTLLGALRDTLGWQADTPAGGLSAWARLPQGSSAALVEVAARHGVHLAPGASMSADGALDGFVRLPFSLDTATLTEAVARLRAAYEHSLAAPPRPRAPTV